MLLKKLQNNKPVGSQVLRGEVHTRRNQTKNSIKISSNFYNVITVKSYDSKKL